MYFLFQLLLRELNNLQNDLDNVKQQAENIMDKADQDSRNTIHTTITVIEERYHKLGKLAKDKENELEVGHQKKEKKDI